MKWFWSAGFFIGLCILLVPLQPAGAVEKGKGLSVAPLRQEVSLEAGTKTSSYVTVGNLSSQPITVSLNIGQFSAADYTYDLKLESLKKDLVKPRQDKTQILPGRSEKIWYDVTVPQKATPGGYYFSISATAAIEGEGLPQTVQATSLLYVTVTGDLVRTSILQDASIPTFVMGAEIPYTFDVKDTGNVHFSAYFYGQLRGLFGVRSEAGTSHILLPGIVRTVKGAIPSPVLPGIYQVEYGYRVDFAAIVTTKTAYIVYIPPWSLVALLFLIIFVRWVWQQYLLRTKKAKDS